ncbi:ComF family protein [Streptomyces sp. NPDC051954]|uniref:ComF family protein n=1 Tax=Streptomyces sp. NPDC051954 TaxID=3155524 RepID=UPI0034354392
MRGWWQDLTDLVLPAECGGCGRPRTVLCPECRAALSGAAPCRVRPVPEPPGLPMVHAAARYADEVRAVLLAHKERGALALAAPLGMALAGVVRAGLSGAQVRDGQPVLLVPVPSARGAVRARGHDPARRIALAAASELRRGEMPARVVSVLRQRRVVADQSGLNSRQRLDNLAGALAVAPGGARLLAEGPVVLVDDLMTTGASLTEAARAVRAATAQAYGPGVYGSSAAAVYAAAAREGTEERRAGSMNEAADQRHGVPGMAGAHRADAMICAAVVAASPDSFEMNRN